jgi:hypothetical protein
MPPEQPKRRDVPDRREEVTESVVDGETAFAI